MILRYLLVSTYFIVNLHEKNIHVCNGVRPQVLSTLVMGSSLYSFNTQQQSRDLAKYFSKITEVCCTN